jgi:signal transduction histidine kinase
VGISGMRERVEGLGGEFRIESVSGEGCTVRAALPLASRA